MKFKKGMHVTFAKSEDRVLHGIIDKINNDGRIYPIIVLMQGRFRVTFTMKGSYREDEPVSLKIRYEL